MRITMMCAAPPETTETEAGSEGSEGSEPIDHTEPVARSRYGLLGTGSVWPIRQGTRRLAESAPSPLRSPTATAQRCSQLSCGDFSGVRISEFTFTWIAANGFNKSRANGFKPFSTQDAFLPHVSFPPFWQFCLAKRKWLPREAKP